MHHILHQYKASANTDALLIHLKIRLVDKSFFVFLVSKRR